MRRASTIFPLAILLLLGRPASGQSCTAYINATDGDDSNPGTQTSPLRSFEYAYVSLPAASVVCVAAGEYFFGDDSDGISLGISGKGMTFVLNSFAGSNEIRFSEKLFEIDVGEASIVFRKGSTDKWAIGEGLENVDNPSAPGLLNFVHTIRLRSGILDITDVVLTVEESVGVPTFVNPVNAAKIAPSDARIEFGDILVDGTILYAAADRTLLFNATAPSAVAYPLPSNAERNRLVFQNESELIIPNELDVGRGTLVLRPSGDIVFGGDVLMNTDSGGILFESGSGVVRFDSDVIFEGGTAADLLIQHSGAGRLEIAHLVTVHESSGGSLQSRFTVDGDGTASVREFTQVASGDGSELLVDLVAQSGEIELGTSGITSRLPGALIVNGSARLLGSIELNRNSDNVALQNSGLIDLGDNQLVSASEGVLIINEQLITANVLGKMALSGSITWSGTGTLPRMDLSGALNLGGDLIVEDYVLIHSMAFLEIAESSRLSILGALSAEPGTSISLLPGSRLEVGDSVSLVESDVSISTDARLIVGSNVDWGASTLTVGEGWLEFSGGGVTSLTASSPIDLPGIAIVQTEVYLDVDATLREINISEGGLSIEGGASLTVLGETRIDSGHLTATEAGPVLLMGPVGVYESALDLGTSESVTVLSNIDWSQGTATFPNGQLTMAGAAEQRIAPSEDFQLQNLSIVETDTRAIIEGSLVIDGDLELPDGTIVLPSGSTLSVSGNLSRVNGQFDPSSNGLLVLTGAGARTISGFQDSALPSLVINGPDISTSEDLRVEGSLRLDAGALIFMSGSINIVHGDLMIQGETFRLGDNALMDVDGSVSLLSGAVDLQNGSILEVGGNVSVEAPGVQAQHSELRFSGGAQQSFDFESPLTIGSVALAGTGTIVSIDADESLTVFGRVSVAEGSQLLLNSRVVTMLGAASPAGLHVDGSIRASTGSVRFSGPDIPGLKFSLSGGGTFPSITVALDSDEDNLLLTGVSPDFSFSGQVHFSSGSIDAAGKIVSPSARYVVPSIRRNLGDEKGTAGRIDGGRFFDSIQPLVFNPENVPYDVVYEGGLTGIYIIGLEFKQGSVRNLEVEVFDAVNTPEQFFVQLSFDAELSGSFRLTKGAILRISGVDLILSAPFLTHLIDGRVTGPGKIVVTGDGVSLTSPERTGNIASLLLLGAPESEPVRLFDLGSVDRLEIGTGTAEIRAPTPGTPSFEVLSSMLLSGGELIISRPMQIGSGMYDATLTLNDGIVTISDAVNVFISSGSSVVINENASVQLGSIGPVPSPDGGYLVFLGDGSIESNSPVPRLRVAFDPDRSESDNVSLLGDLTVTESFVLGKGDVLLGNNNLRMLGGVFSVSEANNPLDNTDGFAGTGGQLQFLGSTRFELNGTLFLDGCDIRVAAGAGGLVDIASPPGSSEPLFTPGSVVIANGKLLIESGTLSLGESDVILEADISGVLHASDGEILAEPFASMSSKSSDLDEDPILFPVDDARFGEIIIAGGSTASIRVGAGVSIPNLSLKGRVRLSTDSAPLMVSGRLAFGLLGADFLTPGPDRLFLRDGAILLRRGKGVLSHAPSVLGAFDLFYDLDDGAFSSVSSQFGPGSLTTGLELSANAENVRNFGILAGSRSGGVNTVVVANDVSIAGTFTLYSGTASFGSSRLAFGDGGHFRILEIDGLAPAGFMSNAGYASDGSIDVSLSYTVSTITTDETLLPTSVDVAQFYAHLGTDQDTPLPYLVLHSNLSADRIVLDAADPSSQFRLAGDTYHANNELLLAGGIVTSISPARLESDDLATLAVGARITDSVSLHASGDILIAGDFVGTTLEASGNVVNTGLLQPTTGLVFKGSHQSFSSVQDVTIDRLEINLEPDAGPEPLRVTMGASGSPFDLSVTGTLVFAKGILDTGRGALLYSGAPSNIIMDIPEGFQSFVSGEMTVYAPAGSQDTVFFPLGDTDQFRPLELSFSEPLSAPVDFTVSHVGAQPFGTIGLPVYVPGSDVLQNTKPFSWELRSSSTIPASQSLSVSVRFPLDQGESGDPYRILSRALRDGSSPWMLLSPSNSVSTESENLQLNAFGIRNGLERDGIELAVGITAAPLFQSEFQFVHANLADPVPGITLFVDGRQVAGILEFDTATASIPLALLDASETHLVSLRTSGSGELVVEVDAPFESGRRTLIAYAPASEGGESSIRTLVAPAEIISASQVGIGFIHASPDFPILGIDLGDSGVTFFENASSADLFGPVVLDADFETIRVLHSFGSGEIDRYSFPFIQLQGQSAFLLLSGLRHPPPAQNGDAGSRLSVVLNDGSVIRADPTTAIETEDPDSVMPGQFRLLGNYPNPFNPETTILFDLPARADITLTVVDILGRVVLEKRLGDMPAGSARSIWLDASALASGMYLYRIAARGREMVYVGTGKLMLVR